MADHHTRRVYCFSAYESITSKAESEVQGRREARSKRPWAGSGHVVNVAIAVNG